MNKKILSLVVAANALALSSFGQTALASQDFETSGSPFSYNYSELGTISRVTDLSGTGAGGSGAAAQLSFDATAAAGSAWAGVGLGQNLFFGEGSILSNDLSTFSFSVDTFVAGLEVPTAGNFNIAIEFQGAGGPIAAFVKSYAGVVGNSYVTLSDSLDTFSVLTGGTAPGGDMGDVSLIDSINFTIRVDSLASFGFDAGNQITMDNIVFSQIPEPSAFALIGGVMALALVATRRRLRK